MVLLVPVVVTRVMILVTTLVTRVMLVGMLLLGVMFVVVIRVRAAARLRLRLIATLPRLGRRVIRVLAHDVQWFFGLVVFPPLIYQTF